MPSLFDPFALQAVTLRNRIGVPPMCQYSAEDGLATAWHLPHYAALARGGAGLVTVEATAVAPEGRITPGCLGLWSDAHTAAVAPLARAIRDAGAVAGIQLAHAGRKASARRPWDGGEQMGPDDPAGWTPVAPSARAHGGALTRVPRAMTLADIDRVQQDFVAAAQRARDAGFQWLELHFAHGYLAQSFFSRHANARDDDYGGSAAGRGRFLCETLRAVRRVWPERLPLTARLGVVEFDGHDEETLQDSIELVRGLRSEGLDLLSISVGFSTADAQVPWGPGFLAPLAARVRTDAGLPVSAAWGFEQPAVAAAAVAAGQIDVALVGRAHLANPHWPHAAAQALGLSRPASLLPLPYAHPLERYRPVRPA